LSSKRPSSGAAADAERRVQPRHFHDGPNPAIVAADSSHAESSAEPGPATAGRLYRHALESIFVFLYFYDIKAVLQVSKSWLGTVRSLSHNGFVELEPKVPLWRIADSAMGRVVTTLGCEKQPLPLDGNALSILKDKMPHLVELRCQLTPTPIDQTFVFPRALTRLILRINVSTDDRVSATTTVNAAIRAIGKLQQLHELHLRLPTFDARLSLAPLSSAALPMLQRLTVETEDEEGAKILLSDTQVNELRAMPQLQTLRLPPHVWTKNLLGRLLRQPQELQW